MAISFPQATPLNNAGYAKSQVIRAPLLLALDHSVQLLAWTGQGRRADRITAEPVPDGLHDVVGLVATIAAATVFPMAG